MKPNLIERDIETLIDKKLRILGWNDNIFSVRRNVYKQNPRTLKEKELLQGKRADYILYSSKKQPLIIIEVKKDSWELDRALEQAINYAQTIKAPLAIATTWRKWKCYHLPSKKPLILNQKQVGELFDENQALKFIDNPNLIKEVKPTLPTVKENQLKTPTPYLERFRVLQAKILKIDQENIENHSKWCSKSSFGCELEKCLKGQTRYRFLVNCSNYPKVEKVFGYDFYFRSGELKALELHQPTELHCRVWMGKHKLIKVSQLNELTERNTL